MPTRHLSASDSLGNSEQVNVLARSVIPPVVEKLHVTSARDKLRVDTYDLTLLVL